MCKAIQHRKPSVRSTDAVVGKAIVTSVRRTRSDRGDSQSVGASSPIRENDRLESLLSGVGALFQQCMGTTKLQEPPIQAMLRPLNWIEKLPGLTRRSTSHSRKRFNPVPAVEIWAGLVVPVVFCCPHALLKQCPNSIQQALEPITPPDWRSSPNGLRAASVRARPADCFNKYLATGDGVGRTNPWFYSLNGFAL